MLPDTTANFGKYFHLEGHTLHVPQNMYMVPNGVAQRALQSSQDPSFICQVNGIGDFKYFFKPSNGEVQLGDYYDERDKPQELGRAKEITIVRDLPAPTEKAVSLWKTIKCNGLVVNDWGIPFAVAEKKKFAELKAMCEAIAQASPEPCFIMIQDPSKKTGYCINKNETNKVTTLAIEPKNQQEIGRITSTFTEIFLVQDGVRIHLDKSKRDLK